MKSGVMSKTPASLMKVKMFLVALISIATVLCIFRIFTVHMCVSGYCEGAIFIFGCFYCLWYMLWGDSMGSWTYRGLSGLFAFYILFSTVVSLLPQYDVEAPILTGMSIFSYGLIFFLAVAYDRINYGGVVICLVVVTELLLSCGAYMVVSTYVPTSSESEFGRLANELYPICRAIASCTVGLCFMARSYRDSLVQGYFEDEYEEAEEAGKTEEE